MKVPEKEVGLNSFLMMVKEKIYPSNSILILNIKIFKKNHMMKKKKMITDMLKFKLKIISFLLLIN
jgi:hypothetical protein